MREPPPADRGVRGVLPPALPCRRQAKIERATTVLNQVCLGLPVLRRQSLGEPRKQT